MSKAGRPQTNVTRSPAAAVHALLGDRSLLGLPIVEFLDRVGRWKVTLTMVGVTTASFIAVLEIASGDIVSLRYLYLVPVVTLTWVRGRAFGLTLASLTIALELGLGLYFQGDLREPNLLNAVVRAVVLVLVIELVHELDVLLQRRTEEADHDSLTGLLNRRAFYRRSSAELVRAARHRRPVAVMFIDLDGFKAINDSCGHDEGDRHLQEFGRRLRETTRDEDIVGRLGGDEFALLLPETALRAALSLADRIHGDGESLAASIGVVTCPPAPFDLDAALGEADRRMYEDKLIRRQQSDERA